jgi:hypothetical protein
MLVDPRLVEGLEWRRLRRLGEVLILVDSGVVKKNAGMEEDRELNEL